MARSLSEILGEIDAGALLEQASEKLAEVVRNVQEVEKPGTFTLTFSIKPNGSNKVFVDAKVTAKSPERAVETSMFFARPNGDLTRQSPKQEEVAAGPRIAVAN